MNIFSRCWSHRRARAESEPEGEPIRVVMHLPDPREAQAVAAPAEGHADRVAAPAPVLQAALAEVPERPEPERGAGAGAGEAPVDRAPTGCESFLNCMRAGASQSARDLIAMIPANGSALVVRAGLSMARTPVERFGVAALCLTGTTALVGAHWPLAARLLVEGSRLRGSEIAECSLTAAPFLLELAALLTPLLGSYEPDDSWGIAQSMLIIMTGSRLANFIRDHVTQVQQGYWGTMQPVTREGLNPTRKEADDWRLSRTGLQTFAYVGLSLLGTMGFAKWINDANFIQDQKAHQDSPVPLDRFVYQLSSAAPRLMASVLLEVLDPLFIAACGFVTAQRKGLRVKFHPGNDASVRDTWNANVVSPQGWDDTRKRARLHTGMRMGLQSGVDVATGWSTLFAARDNAGMADGMRALLAILNGLTEPRGFLVDWCNRATSARPVTEGHSAAVARAQRDAVEALNHYLPQITEALQERGLPPTPENIASLFVEFVPPPAPQAVPDADQEREQTVFTGEITVAASGPAAFRRGLI